MICSVPRCTNEVLIDSAGPYSLCLSCRRRLDPAEYCFLRRAAVRPEGAIGYARRELIAESLLNTLAVERDFETEHPELYEVME